ncbi:MAG: AMP-binding protein, partial [Acidimicrobiia bacterium]|nr:AMP-binding protein [Acidimicrobiia bacterium]
MTTENIPAQILENGSRFGSQPAYWVKTDADWVSTSWSEYADLVKVAARSLMALGIQPGQVVTIIGFNRPEWVIADVAAMA